jgi:hypothetical protein
MKKVTKQEKKAYFLDRISINCPPAAFIAADEPVAVEILFSTIIYKTTDEDNDTGKKTTYQIPLDQTLKENISSRDKSVL